VSKQSGLAGLKAKTGSVLPVCVPKSWNTTVSGVVMAAPLLVIVKTLVGVPPEAPKVILVGFVVSWLTAFAPSGRVVNAPLALPTLKISVR
jgi:hypothetical protein